MLSRTPWKQQSRNLVSVGAVAFLLGFGVIGVSAAVRSVSSVDDAVQPSPAPLAITLQRLTHLDIGDPIVSLDTVSREATLVGVGEIQRIEEGFTVESGVFADSGAPIVDREVYLVIAPEHLLVSPSGFTGEIHIPITVPPQLPLEELQTAVSQGARDVAFVLHAYPGPDDRFASTPRHLRPAEFYPVQESLLLGLNGIDRFAFPLMTDEQIPDSTSNRDYLASLGLDEYRFGTLERETRDTP